MFVNIKGLDESITEYETKCVSERLMVTRFKRGLRSHMLCLLVKMRVVDRVGSEVKSIHGDQAC